MEEHIEPESAEGGWKGLGGQELYSSIRHKKNELGAISLVYRLSDIYRLSKYIYIYIYIYIYTPFPST